MYDNRGFKQKVITHIHRAHTHTYTHTHIYTHTLHTYTPVTPAERQLPAGQFAENAAVFPYHIPPPGTPNAHYPKDAFYGPGVCVCVCGCVCTHMHVYVCMCGA